MPTQRPTLSADPDWLQAARDAVDDFVAELQAGIDSGDAETYNAHFSDDVAGAARTAPPWSATPRCIRFIAGCLTGAWR